MQLLWLQRIYLLDVIVKTTSCKVGDVIVFADFLWVLPDRRRKYMKSSESKSNCDVNKVLHNSTHLEVLNEKAPGRVVDHRVESVRVQCQRVVVVKAVDVHFSQVDLIVGIDGRGVEGVTSTWWDQVWSREEHRGRPRSNKNHHNWSTDHIRDNSD